MVEKRSKLIRDGEVIVRLSMIVAAILTVAGVGMAQEPAREAPKPYELRVGDVIQISVAADRRLDNVQVVRPDGKIAIKLIGEFQAEGVTVARLRAVLTEKIEEFLPSPKVNVFVMKVAPPKPVAPVK